MFAFFLLLVPGPGRGQEQAEGPERVGLGPSRILLEQPFVKDNASTVGELITQMVSKLGENILVSRMARFKVGEADA